MEKIFKHIRIMMVCLLMLILTFSANNVNAQLVTNGSFEATEPGVVTDYLNGIEGWKLQLLGDAIAEFQVMADQAQKGDHSLKIVPQSLGNNQWSIQASADNIPVIPGKTYHYSVWAKAQTVGAQVSFTAHDYAYIEYASIRPATLTTEWQEFTMEFTIFDNQTVIMAPIHFNFAVNVGNVIYIDNLVITNADAVKPIIVEAESGEVGSDYSILQEDSTEYVAIQTNSAAYNPGSNARVISYEVTFPDTGTYDLFVRLRVGPDSWDDDSFFYGNGFGEKESTNDADWILVNGLAVAGFSEPDDIVFEAGEVGSEVWKWVNLSHNAYQGNTPRTFTVEGNLTKTFQIGAREDGLDIDKIAFGSSYLYYTVGDLDKGPIDVWGGPPLASKQPKFVGNIFSPSQVDNFEAYWNQVTPDNAGKWGSVEITRDNMHWSMLDAAYNLAKDNDFPFNFHVLIWGCQQPDWINTLSPEEQLEEIREWFQAVAYRYPDIEYLQVVNEALPHHNPPDGNNGRVNYKEALGGDGETGWDWVLNAFRMAREIFPSETKLMINDFNTINISSNTSQYLTVIRLLQAENLIDAIGEQAHSPTTKAHLDTMKKNLDALASTGLPIQITEMDIDGPSDTIQLQDYQRTFPALYEHPSVEGITLWGWKHGLWRHDQGAYIMNQDGSERPALTWLRQYLDTLSIQPVLMADFYASLTSGLAPLTVQFTDRSSGDITSYLWDFGDGGTSTAKNPSHTYENPGTYTVKLTVTGPIGSNTKTRTDYITVTSSLENMLLNGDFSDGTNHWILWVDPSASAIGAVQNGEYVISITNGGNYTYNVEIFQPNLTIENGKTYDVSFDAYADALRQINPFIGMNKSPWIIYDGYRSMTISTTKQTYTYSFTMNHDTDADARIAFDVGASNTDVRFDNIVLTKRRPSNMLFNGEFTHGTSGWYLYVTSPAAASCSVQDGELVASITHGGNNSWDVQLNQRSVLLENGSTYQVSFDAYAASPREIIPNTSMASAPWTIYGGYHTVTLSTTKQAYTYSFTMNHATDPDARVTFNLGQSTADVYLDNIMLTKGTSSIKDRTEFDQFPESFELSQNYPNPFNPETHIGYQLADKSSVTLSIFNLQGQLVRTLVDEEQAAGMYSVYWDGRDHMGDKVPSAVYVYRLETNSAVFSKKMILIK